jgi:hypothetical protein
VPNPTGEVEGVAVERNGGATTSTGYEIHVVAAGSPPRDSNLVAVINGPTRNGHTGVDLVWRTPTMLAVQYLQARDAELIVPQIQRGGRTIWVTLGGPTTPAR